MTAYYSHRQNWHVCRQQFLLHPPMWADSRILHKQLNARMNAFLQATILVAGQMGNLSDPVLNADPLFGITGQIAHTP